MKKILILDDEPDTIAQHLYSSGDYREHYRKELGVDVTFVTTPRAAEEILQGESFDFLFLDGFLVFDQEGGKTLYGPDVLADWQSRAFALPPVYMISSDADMCARGIALGAKGKLSKDTFSPFSHYYAEKLEEARVTLASLT